MLNVPNGQLITGAESVNLNEAPSDGSY